VEVEDEEEGGGGRGVTVGHGACVFGMVTSAHSQ
jgi:hypothetical protein